MTICADTTTSPTRMHVALRVADLALSIEFYRKLFDTEPAKVRAGYAKFEPPAPPVNFTLNESPGSRAEKGGLAHLGIEVEDAAAVTAARERLRRAGLATRSEEDVTCCYAVQDKVWVTDPDGNEWEVFTVLRDASGRDADASACCAGECGP